MKSSNQSAQLVFVYTKLELGRLTGAGTIHDSKNQKSIQNSDFSDFQVNRESTIRQNEGILSIKESVQESRIDLISRFSGEP